MSPVLLVGCVLLLTAVVSLYVAVAGVPGRRVARARVRAFAVAEHRSVLNRAASAVEDGVDELLQRRGWRPFTAAELTLAGVRQPVSTVVVLIVCGSFGVFALGFVLVGALLGAVLAVLTPVLVKIWLRWRAGRTCRRFGDQLPQALQMMAASLRAGHSLPRVIDAVSRELDAPMGTEMARVVNENRLGRDLVESLEDVAERMRCRDFHWVAGAIGAQRETGGNLNEILDQVAETIRDRQHVRQQVMTLSAEGRLSAIILMALPVGIGVYYSVVAAEQMNVFVGEPIGKLLLAGSALLYVMGGFWMRSVVRIEF